MKWYMVRAILLSPIAAVGMILLLTGGIINVATRYLAGDSIQHVGCYLFSVLEGSDDD